MRRVEVAAVSVGAHAVLVYALSRVLVHREIPAQLDEPPAASAHGEPIEFVVVEPQTATGPTDNGAIGSSGSPVAHAAPVAGSRGGPGGDRITVTGPGTGTETQPGTGDHGPSRFMKMRGPELRLGDGFLDRFAAATKPLEPPATKTGRVDPSGGGTSTIRDRVTTVEVERDGSAHFHDKPAVSWHWDFHLPTPDAILDMARQTGRDVATWYEDPYAQARAGRIQDLPRHMTATPGACDSFYDACSTELRQAAADDEDKDRSDGVAHGRMDLTGLLMRKLGVGDPYASRKLALLDSTRAERAEIGAKYRREQLGRAAELIQKNLEALWRNTPDPAQRRSILFTMWDECGEGDGAEGEAGQRARLVVIGWIRAKLPAGSPNAFTPADIARLDKDRASKQHFAPYDD